MRILVKLLLSTLATVIALIPLWIYWGSYHFLSPEGFWQKLLVFGFGVYILGAIQLMFLVFLIGVLFLIWTEID
jgi:hypothetical protein